jgi:hypothetical protein
MERKRLTVVGDDDGHPLSSSHRTRLICEGYWRMWAQQALRSFNLSAVVVVVAGDRHCAL